MAPLARKKTRFGREELSPFAKDDLKYSAYELVDVVSAERMEAAIAAQDTYVAVELPLDVIIPKLLLPDLKAVSRLHGLNLRNVATKASIIEALNAHVCDTCPVLYTLLSPYRAEMNEDGKVCKSANELAEILTCFKTITADDLAVIVGEKGVPAVYKRGARITALAVGGDDVRSGDLWTKIDLQFLASKLSQKGLVLLGRSHGLEFPRRWRVSMMQEQFKIHRCDCQCADLWWCLSPVTPKPKPPHSGENVQPEMGEWEWPEFIETKADFPPKPKTVNDKARIVKGFVEGFSEENVAEGGCAVCGQLHLKKDLVNFADQNVSLLPLVSDQAARRERKAAQDNVKWINEPIVDSTLSTICRECCKSLRGGRRPRLALANGLWVGEVPPCLADLTFTEQLLVARVRSNCCVIRVSTSGHKKMIGNVVSFPTPTAKVYKKLPLSKEELNDVVAFVFVGVQPPTYDDLKRTPFFVRREVVLRALDWLKLNHRDYADLEIDHKALNEYEDGGAPVNIMFRQVKEGEGNVVNTAMSVDSNDIDDGTDTGRCPYRVHGLTGSQYAAMTPEERKAAALVYLKTGKPLLAVGQGPDPESLYDNPSLYPQMYPWLFPYGMGGVGQERLANLVSESAQKKWLLNYHDKRFQKDAHFIIVAFNHEQIKTSVLSSYIMAKRRSFKDIAAQIRDVNPDALLDIARRMEGGKKVIPTTDEERRCFLLLNQIERAGVFVGGSMAGKKKMRTELWSLVNFLGSPTWFITFAPADAKHPLCLYWAGQDIKFNPFETLPAKMRVYLSAGNPVACAKFFDKVVRLFIKHVLGWDEDEEGDEREGLYGKTAGYYGTVEQQGRMTLHLHLILWIVSALSPNEIRERLTNKDSAFQKALVDYLEDCHIGECMEEPLKEVQAKIKQKRRQGRAKAGAKTREEDDDDCWRNPTVTLPTAPPVNNCQDATVCRCKACDALKKWYEEFKCEVNELIALSHVHECYARRESEGNDKKVHKTAKGCLNKDGICMARFPREIFSETCVNVNDGHLNMKKLEPMINHLTPTLTYLLRCNSDVTCLLSGTAVKAVVAYVTDYVTKSSLKTYQVFSTSYDVFLKNEKAFEIEASQEDAARRLIMKVSNALTAKMEIGAPMAALYLLGNPDKYSSHEFRSFYWKSFVIHVQRMVARYENRLEGKPVDIEKDFDAMMLNNVVVDENGDNAEGDLSGDAGEDSDSEDELDEGSEYVQLKRNDNTFVGQTTVDEYIFRPEEFEDICLYDWVQCSVRVKGQPDTLSSKRHHFFCYKPQHPLHKTHAVTCDPSRRHTVVPHFLGSALPRHDTGDLEDYSCAMLTLFVPWRTGIELKEAGESWKQAFERREFDARCKRLMQNLRLRYECYDARDDYAAQLKKAGRALAVNIGTGIDLVDGEEVELEGFDVDDDSLTVSATKGRLFKDREGRFAHVQQTLANAGWDNTKVSQRLTSAPGVLTVDSQITASDWRKIVARKRRDVIAERFAAIMPAGKGNGETTEKNAWMKRSLNAVKVVPGKYLFKDFAGVRGDTDHRREQKQICDKFLLNYEQQKAYEIITNHAVSVAPPPLRMYIGGMGGTGKSRVISAVLEFFKGRGEAYRIVVLAPTGNAAALVNGSTYHSFLNIYPGAGEDMNAKVDELRGKLFMVNYILIDEVSMLSCYDMYRISRRLALAMNRDDEPFGGVNMIFAGDFAQLPPTMGFSLYSRSVQMIQTPRQTLRQQNNTIGKNAWYQVNTVVMLKQNMRQASQSEEDEKLRRALKNLRWYACDDKDLQFLRSRIPANNQDIDMNHDDFRLTAIITSRNAAKDGVNESYSKRFAEEHGVELQNFYSVDTETAGDGEGFGQRRGFRERVRGLTKRRQVELWNQWPNTSGNVAAKLSLCVGLPVCIRHNVATELCMTKGQDAEVVGWVARPHDRYPEYSVLEVVFVRLVNAPKSVKLSGLPENVVPLTRTPQPVVADLQDDKFLTISRSQIPILPNFSMTDYASQGKTREFNVVDIFDCRSHQAAYTCLSRGSKAAGTVILQDFPDSKVRGKIERDLRMEFRDLDLLDEMTEMIYGGMLPDGILHLTRQDSLRAFRNWKGMMAEDDDEESEGEGDVGSDVWSDNFSEWTADEDIDGETIENEWKSAIKRARIDLGSEDERERKKRKLTAGPTEQEEEGGDDGKRPFGLTWDGFDHSCAYDSVLAVLFNLWRSDPTRWTGVLHAKERFLRAAVQAFPRVLSGEVDINDVRDDVRKRLREHDSAAYPIGSKGCDIFSLVLDLIATKDTLATNNLVCVGCGGRWKGEIFRHFGDYRVVTIATSLVDELERCEQVQGTCGGCGREVLFDNVYTDISFVQCENGGVEKGDVPLVIQSNRAQVSYMLRGAIYYGGHHFVARWIDMEGEVFYHDSMSGSRYAKREGNIGGDGWGQRLWEGRGRRLSLLMWSKL